MSEELRDWADREQKSLWKDLLLSIRYAKDGIWSPLSEELLERLVGVIKSTGSIAPAVKISCEFATSGVYEEVHRQVLGDITEQVEDDLWWSRLHASTLTGFPVRIKNPEVTLRKVRETLDALLTEKDY